jgi:hypothetical protein
VDARPPKFQDLAADYFEGPKVKKLLAVITQIPLGSIPALHPVRSYQLASGFVAYHQVVEDEIKAVPIEPGRC